MTKVFVYGTLKKGHHNHIYLEGSKFIKQAYVPGFSLINATAYPYALEAELTDFAIGEVYEVNEATLEALDYLEGYPDHYNRRKINAYDLDSLVSRSKASADEAWIYYIESDRFNMLERFGTTHEWGIKPQQYRYNYHQSNKEVNRAIAELFEEKGE